MPRKSNQLHVKQELNNDAQTLASPDPYDSMRIQRIIGPERSPVGFSGLSRCTSVSW